MKRTIFTLMALALLGCRGGDDTNSDSRYDILFEASHLVGTYHANEHSEAYNYNIVLSDYSADSDSYAPCATYYYFEIYSDYASRGGEYVDLPTPNNTSTLYSYDSDNKQRRNTFAAELSYVITTDAECNPTRHNYTSGKLTIKRNGYKAEIVAELTMDDGTLHRVEYSGPSSFKNLNNEPYSTLDGDLALDLQDMTLYTENLGAYSYGVECRYIMLSEDAVGEDGKLLLIEVLVPSDNTPYNIYNTLDFNSYLPEEFFYTYFPGSIEDSALRGAWYAIMEGGSVGDTMAPIVNGTIAITEGDDNTTLFEFDCLDDAGNKITGTASALGTIE